MIFKVQVERLVLLLLQVEYFGLRKFLRSLTWLTHYVLFVQAEQNSGVKTLNRFISFCSFNANVITIKQFSLNSILCILNGTNCLEKDWMSKKNLYTRVSPHSRFPRRVCGLRRCLGWWSTPTTRSSTPTSTRTVLEKVLQNLYSPVFIYPSVPCE